ncbi:VOC family protein [Aurantimonas sp. MSK8Z-1]|uniref:VOC family protein n=1 Tax=Mangrovibrevibacter kandeliae TaxID=2968473 RepID=UPI0021179D79|nr:VOC family protein [Aurantimonas sp. MSK8Z-1]MCW4116786.1 VOC family protein [Aurantimonas sp. MSK8Z-1]
MTPSLRIGRVVLTVRDLEKVAAFYRDVVGLQRLEGAPGRQALGAGGVVLVELREDRSAAPARPDAAGLFHTAFLLPRRADLAAWMLHAVEGGVAIEGASDHAVSEAVYLSDPEGNGVEIYADAPRETWRWEGGSVHMTTRPLDFRALAETATGPWRGAPDGTSVGHAHLKVGDTGEAERFYRERLGLAVTHRRSGAVFLSSDGYHHHLGANSWASRGAGKRPAGAAGLACVEVVACDAASWAALAERNGFEEAAGEARIEDPWGTAIVLRPHA